MDNVCWVETIADADATGDVATMYDAVRYNGEVENLYRAGSLFPAPMVLADEWYKAVMHDPNGPLPYWESELAATYVAILCGCQYALSHHGENFCQRHDHPSTARQLLDRLIDDPNSKTGDRRTDALLTYTAKLTLHPAEVQQSDISSLREAGFSDPQIVHLNQAVAAFGYWVRYINGLGIQLGDGPIGLDIT